MPSIGKENFQTVKATGSPSTTDIAWAAGFMEGEANFRGSHNTLRFVVKQVNLEPLIWLRHIFGGSIGFISRENERDTGQHVKDVYWWAVSGARARGVAYTVFTFLTAERKRQVRLALEEGDKYVVE